MGLDMCLYSYNHDRKREYKDREYWIEWRKANAIHAWFVSEIQGGIDEWNEYPVPVEKLVELMELCVAAYDSNWLASSNLMPTMVGPFFGSTEYDAHYYEELRYTIFHLKRLLGSPASKRVQFYYQASW